MPMYPMVGMHFRPPAKQLIAALAAGTDLILVPEPENPYDAKAIKVLLDFKSAVPIQRYGQLDEALTGTGFQVEDLLMLNEPLHVGYVADSDGKFCRQNGLFGNRELGEAIAEWPAPAKLGFDMTGQPSVIYP